MEKGALSLATAWTSFRVQPLFRILLLVAMAGPVVLFFQWPLVYRDRAAQFTRQRLCALLTRRFSATQVEGAWDHLTSVAPAQEEVFGAAQADSW
jgi:hypothetical protein